MNNRKLYPENWNDTIRPKILARDNYKCQDCRIKHRSYIYIDQNEKVMIVDVNESKELREGGYRSYRVYLQVAHKDNDKQNNDANNLISLCGRCHYKRDRVYKQLMRIANLVQVQKSPGQD